MMEDTSPYNESEVKTGSSELRLEHSPSSNQSKGDRDDENPKYAADGSLGGIKHIYSAGQVDGKHIWQAQEPDYEDPAEDEETAQYAIVVRNKRSHSSRKKFEIHSLVVQSPCLRQALARILRGYPGVSFYLKPLEFTAPFDPFVHRWSQLMEYPAESSSYTPDVVQHLDLLREILRNEVQEDMRRFEECVLHGVVTFELVRMLFQPSSIVLSAQSGTLSAYKLEKGSLRTTRTGREYSLQVNSIDWNGTDFGQLLGTISIPEFEGTMPITDLDAFPLTSHPDEARILRRLVDRGRRFEQLCGVDYKFKQYAGAAVGFTPYGKKKVSCSGRVLVDESSFRRFSSETGARLIKLPPADLKKERQEGTEACVTSEASPGWTSDSDGEGFAHEVVATNDFRETPALGINLDDGEGSSQARQCRQPRHLNESQHLICSPRLRGYSLKLKIWLELFVELVFDISWNEHAFDKLVMPATQKDLILSFAEAQTRHHHTFDDVIAGKGRGMILLLAGPPGVGKTLTAESVAESMRVPLFSLSAGDLGIDAVDVEKSLKKIMEMVSKWNAVLLLGECDVFLQARSPTDLERNMLVSVFLRMLEYYQGLLFMTTNRLEHIDEAFQSRIHISLEYPALTPESRAAVWRNFLSVMATTTAKSKDRLRSGADTSAPNSKANSARAATAGPRATSKARTEALPAAHFSEADIADLATVELNGRQIKNVLKSAQLLALKRQTPLNRELVDIVLDIEGRRSLRTVSMSET